VGEDPVSFGGSSLPPDLHTSQLWVVGTQCSKVEAVIASFLKQNVLKQGFLFMKLFFLITGFFWANISSLSREGIQKIRPFIQNSAKFDRKTNFLEC